MRGEQRWRETDSCGRGGEAGLTLVELAVVVAILSILAGIVTLSVRDANVTARGAAKAHDTNEVLKAVNAYHALQPQGKYPTLGKQSGPVSIEAGAAPTLTFSVDNPLTFLAIDWDAALGASSTDSRKFVPDFLLKRPKHAGDTTLDADGDGVPEQAAVTTVWVIEKDGLVRVLLKDSNY